MFSLVLAVVKLAAFFFSGSMLVLGSFFDSFADMLSSAINHYVFNLSREEADREHPFGHGGFEVVAGLVQGLIIVFLGGMLLVEIVRNALNPADLAMERDGLPIAVLVMVTAALSGAAVHSFIARALRRLEESKERSISMLADKLHYAGDAWANAIGAVGLLLVFYFDKPWLDLLFGALAAVALILSAIPILRKSLRDILNIEAPVTFQQEIVDLVLSSDDRIVGIHALRTREMGPVLFIDFHLKLPSILSLEEAHKIGDAVEQSIKQVFVRADILIHLDPESEEDQQPWNPSYLLPKDDN